MSKEKPSDWVTVLRDGYVVGKDLNEHSHEWAFKNAEKERKVVAIPSQDGDFIYGGMYKGIGSLSLAAPYMTITLVEGAAYMWTSPEVENPIYFPVKDENHQTYGLGVVFSPPLFEEIPRSTVAPKEGLMFSHLWLNGEWKHMTVDSSYFKKEDIHYLGTNPIDGDIYVTFKNRNRFILRKSQL